VEKVSYQKRHNTRIQPTGFASLRSARLRVMRQPLARFRIDGVAR